MQTPKIVCCIDIIPFGEKLVFETDTGEFLKCLGENIVATPTDTFEHSRVHAIHANEIGIVHETYSAMSQLLDLDVDPTWLTHA
jgi:hypothetical protein